MERRSMIPWYVWVAAAALAALAGLVNDRNLVCLIGAGLCVVTSVATRLSIIPPIWFELLLLSTTLLLCLIFVKGPPSSSEVLSDEGGDR